MIFLLLSLGMAQTPTAPELVGLSRLGQAALAPNGRSLVFVETTHAFDPALDSASDSQSGWTTESVLLEKDLKTGVLRALTWGETSVSNPQWSPDGTWLAYERGGDEPAILLLPPAGGEPRTLKTGELEPASWAWVDAAHIGFSATPAPTKPEAADAWSKGEAYEHDARYRNARLYTVDLDGGEPVAITDGSEHVVDWKVAAGGWLALVGPNSDPYRSWVEGSLVVFRDGVRTVLEATPECLETFGWSPSGARAAWAACEGSLSIPGRVMVYEVATGEVRQVLPDVERTVNSLIWEDEHTVLLNVSERTETRLQRVDVARGKVSDAGFAGGLAAGVPVVAGKGLILETTSPEQPGRLERMDHRGKREVLYDPNPHTASWALGETRVFTWTGPEGTALEGLLIRPAGATGPTPLVVMPHGGPDGVSMKGFDGWARFFAARGYAVFRPNYRGGVGYGLAFYAANRGRLGEIEFGEIEAGVDALIAAKLANPEQLFYGGWSWGGYLTAWTIGHTPRYKAAMAGAAVVDVVNQYVTSDINHGVIADWEYTARPWAGVEAFDRSDPSRFLAGVQTPTLILHGDADTRVAFAQGLTLYRALQDAGVETELWVYPGANHGLHLPAHNVHRLEAWAAWFARFGGPGKAQPSK